MSFAKILPLIAIGFMVFLIWHFGIKPIFSKNHKKK